ncbi:MAG: sigma-70 family RNA polymerase sigma factor [Bacteroidetes bacterium]|nr:sigma-70 family RNA polymerase sigma factor [Bacteroidota bacterium]
MFNEHNVIAGCKRKEMWARKELYERYAGSMLSICARYTGCRDTARDVLQDGFYKVFTKIDDYAGNGSFEGWLKRIFVTTALEQLRKKRFAPIIDEYEEIIEDTETLAFDKLSTDDLHRCIAELPDGFRTVFNLYAIEGYSHAEIATMLKIKEVTSRSQFMRARQILQKNVQQFISQENATQYI